MAYLEITEEWIKDRVKITNEKLDDIKSLSLPGTYDEKIHKIGPSLIHFTRLKELDLSRNCLETISGLEHLCCLENLNLYYNNILSLKELYKLRYNYKLVQLDLRLNPVARNEADYRLCLIHMLPLLVKLDDRSVKDQERKAALMYFGSDQSHEFDVDSFHENKNVNSHQQSNLSRKSNQPRVDTVNRWTKGIIKDDENVFVKPYQSEFNCKLEEKVVAKEARCVEEYSPKDSNFQKRLDVEREYNQMQKGDFKNNKLNPLTMPVSIKFNENLKSSSKMTRGFNDIDILNNQATGAYERSNHNYDAYTTKSNKSDIKSITTTTSATTNNVVGNMYNSSSHQSHSTDIGNSHFNSLPLSLSDKLCDIVDKHWSGHHSLHRNNKFLNLLSQILSQEFYQLDKVNKLKEENASLNQKLKDSNNIKMTNGESIENIQHTNNMLKDQIKDLRKRLESSERISEVTELLKQSHDSLIVTNEELRKQLSQQIYNQPSSKFLKHNGCY